MIETVRWLTKDGRVLAGAAGGDPLLPGKVRLIDQTRLPGRLVYLEIDRVPDMVAAIRRLAIRGAPAIGCGAALGLAAAMQHVAAATPAAFRAETARLATQLECARPTAVNLAWALRRCRAALRGNIGVADLRLRLVRTALAILEEDIALCQAIGRHGAPLIRAGVGVLTHCNAGALAAGDYGTALAVLYTAHAEGRRFTVYADETRPLLQGARLTAWELARAGLDVVTICDNMAAAMMQAGRVQAVIVGADRVAANGDTANKIGTYGLAVLARHHRIPFYVAMPYSTIDLGTPDGRSIPIEERDPEEVRRLAGRRITPPRARVANPAFDVAPHSLITAFITDTGILRPPFPAALAAAARRKR